ncbi:MAG: hypothetical protein R2856_34000 [Caldilineaceae bacterium]
MGNEDRRPDYAYSEDFTLRIYQLADGGKAEAVIPNLDGTVMTIALCS